MLYFRGCTARDKLPDIQDATEKLLRSAGVDYHILDDLEFITLADETYKTAIRVKGVPILLKEDNQIFTMDKALYKIYFELCCDLLIKVKRSWS